MTTFCFAKGFPGNNGPCTRRLSGPISVDYGMRYFYSHQWSISSQRLHRWMRIRLISTSILFRFWWGISGRKAKFSYLAFFPLNLRALWTVLRGEKISFTVTPKLRQEGNFLYLVYPQLAVVVLTALGILYGWTMFAAGKNVHAFEALVLNSFWGLNNIFAMTGIIRAAVWKPDEALPNQQVPGDSAATTSEGPQSAEDDGLLPKAA